MMLSEPHLSWFDRRKKRYDNKSIFYSGT